MKDFAQMYMDALTREISEFKEVMDECENNPKRLRRETLFYMQTMREWLQARLNEAKREDV